MDYTSILSEISSKLTTIINFLGDLPNIAEVLRNIMCFVLLGFFAIILYDMFKNKFKGGCLWCMILLKLC